MKHYIIGLGNPGAEYEHSRHNVGRMIVDSFRRAQKFPDWEFDVKGNALVSKGKLGTHDVILILPETFMNTSGAAVKKYVTSKKGAENMVVVYDDLDLGLGTTRISYSRSSAGHKGVDSITNAVGTKDFARLRIGISKITPKGIIKKVKGENAVVDFVLKSFGKPEQLMLQAIIIKGVSALETLIKEGRVKAMNDFN